MNSYIEMYNNICRICLTYKDNKNNVSLIDNNSEDGLSYYGKAVTTFANICIQKDNNLPCTMCCECLKLLKQAIRFKLKCENSEKTLLNWTESYKTNGNFDIKIEEVFVQNIMFSQYFPEEANKNISGKKSQKQNQITEIIEDSDGNNEDFIVRCDNEEKQQNISETNNSDEILNIMENNLTEYAKMHTLDHKMCRSKRLLLPRNRLQIRKEMRLKSMLAQNNSKQKKLDRTDSRNKLNTKQKFICTICNKDLANQNTFRYHMQRHNGCNYICEHCGKGFPVYAELQLHQLVRHDTGPYLQCKHCSYKAPRHHNLIEHERLHTGERPYTCDKCGLTFRRRAIWRKHMIYHTEKSIQCTQCPRKFFRRSEMEAHANSVHERRYVYLCHKCDTVYAKTATVRRHLTERHGIPREMQGKITRIEKARGSSLFEQ